MGPMMYGESAGMGIRSFTLGSFDNSPNDRASVSAFHVNMLPPYWRSLLGQIGFTLIAIAALLSTSSAVNVTLFGAANVSYQMAKDGEFPESFTRKVWSRNSEGLFI